MSAFEEFRDKKYVYALVDAITRKVTRPWTIMEICGGQTHAIARYRLEELLPSTVHLVHGPGCPVCVTPESIINEALQIARRPDVIFASFGDMVRVPGASGSLLSARSEGADLRILYSPLDAVKLAEENPSQEVVFLGIGFETTAPLHALALREAIRKGLTNFSLLTSLVTVPAALRALFSEPDNCVQGLLAAGHVCAVTGYGEYHALAKELSIPVSVTGFEPVDLLWGVYNCIEQLEAGTCDVRNAYPRVVNEMGNQEALRLMREAYEVVDQEWRGLGVIPQSGLRLRKIYEPYNASIRFNTKEESGDCSQFCHVGEVMRGKIHPCQCPEFAGRCTPEHPLGAAMVSGEGACAAFYKYARKS